MSSFLLMGKPGSGKTTLACSMIKAGFNVHVIDVDRKIKNMNNLQSYLESGQLTFTEIVSPLGETSLARKIRATKKIKDSFGYVPIEEPRGYIEVCETIDSLKEKPFEDAQNAVLVLDSASRVGEHLTRLLKNMSKVPKLGFDEWACILDNYEELFTTFISLQPEPYAHVIVTVHIRDEYDRDGALTEHKPLLEGQFRDKVAGYFEEAYYLEVDAVGKNAPVHYRLYTKPVGLIKHARTSRNLNTYIKADFEEIMKA